MKVSVRNPEILEACLERVLSSPVFASADRLREFLRFVVEQTLAGNADSLKETVIGVTVFDRPPGYDPKTDNIVRTSARRLRAKLEEYYAADGAADPARIELPKGSYVPICRVFEEVPRAGDAAIAAEAAAVPEAVIPSSPPQPLRNWFPLILLAGVGVAVLVALLWAKILPVERQSSALWHSVPFSSLRGYQAFPSISPDGKRVAFTWGGSDNDSRQIYVQSIGSQTARRLTDGTADSIRPAWSPDGRQIAFLRIGTDGNKEVFTVAADPSSDQQPRKVAAIQGSDPWLCEEPRLSWSPQGNPLVSVEENRAAGTCGIVVIDLHTGKKHSLTQPPKGKLADVEPAFSPDGKWVAFLQESSASIADVFLISIDGGDARRLTSDAREVRGFSWSADGKGIIVASRREENFLNLWRLPLDNRPAVRLTEGSLNIGFPSASLSGDRIAYVAYRDDSNIWRFNAGANQRWIESRAADASAQYSPDGRKIAFLSDRTGNMDLWTADADGRNPVRITDFGHYPVGSPAWSPDGRRLSFDVRIEGQSDIYLVDAEPGRKPERLTKWPSNKAVPTWSRDGRWVYFASMRSGAWNIYRVSPMGGEPEKITQKGAIRALESPDGKFLFFTKNGAHGIWRMPLSSSVSRGEHADEEVVVPNLPINLWSSWAFGPRGLYYLSPGAGSAKNAPADINLLDLASMQTLRIGSTQRKPTGSGFSVSPDGTSFLYSQLDESGSDILTLEK